MPYNRTNILVLILITVALASLLASYYQSGPLWDFIVHYLNARSFISGTFLSRNFTIIQGQVIQKGAVYVELLRPPMPSAVFLLLIPFFSNPLLAYLVLIFAFFIVAIWQFSKMLGFDRLITYSLMLNPYFIYMSFTISSEEILSLSFLLITIGLIYRKRALAGVFLALACMSKYPTLAFIPILLLLWKREKIALSYLLFSLTTLPWLLFNLYFFGSPLASYAASVNLNITNGAPITIYLVPALMAIAIPAAMLLFGLLHLDIKKIRGTVAKALKSSDFTKIAAASAILSIVAWAFASLHASFFDQIRYSYLLCTSMILLALVILQYECTKVKDLQRNLWIASLLLLVISAAVFYYYYPKPNYNDVYYSGSGVNDAVNELNMLGYSNCSVITNAWPYLLFTGVNAYSPWSLNATTSTQYPVVLLKSVGISGSYIWNINSSHEVYNSSEVAIFYPQNTSCIRASYG